MELDSMPTEIDQMERQIMMLEMERQALRKEKDAVSKERLEKLEKELADWQQLSSTVWDAFPYEENEQRCTS